MAEEEQQVNDADFEGLDEGMDNMGAEDGAAEGIDELEAMKQKLKELEEEAAKLRNTQGGAAAEGMDDEAAAESAKEEADARSVFVNNVDFGTTPEELQQVFATCGTVNRVTILADKFGTPKGYAYVEFMEADAVDNAIMLDNQELRGRPIKVMRKRTNVPGLKRGRGRGRGGYYGGRGYGAPRGRGYHGYGGYYGGYASRGRGRGRGYSPY